MSRKRLVLAAVALVGTLAYLPNLGVQELRYEEPRRAMPARAMLETGDFVTPQLLGEPYLTKPPLYFWTVAALGSIRGSVDEVATRLPSALAVILTGILVAWFTMRLGGPTAGAIAGLGFLLSPTVLRSGSLGETDGLFGGLVFVTLVGLWQSRRAGRSSAMAIVVGGLALGAALLTKGPQAFVFVTAGIIGLVAARESRQTRLGPAAAIIMIGVGLAGIWVVALLQVSDTALATSIWTQELSRGGFDLGSYFSDKISLLVRTPLGLLPIVVVLGVAWREELLKGWRGNPPLVFLLVTVGLSFLFFVLYPASRPRYFYPAAPVAAVLAGLAAGVDLERFRHSRVMRSTGVVVAAVAGCIAVIGLIPALRGRIGIPSLSSLSLLLLIGLALVAALLVRQTVRRSVSLSMLVVPILMIRLLSQVEVVPDRADRRGFREAGAAIARLVGQPERSAISFHSHYAALYYSDLPLKAVSSPSDVSAGTLLIRVREDSSVPDPQGFRRLGEVPVADAYLIRVLVRE